jgi:LPXTG-motif cell wall-anchored protein
MRRSILAAAAAALLVPAAALAKEPAQVTISGPGFHKTLSAPESPDFTSTVLGRVTEQSGFFPAAVGQSPDPMLHGRPAGKLGPRFTIVWTVPESGNTHRVRQELFPYAARGALTYMKPGQPIFDTTTKGGWYRAYGLKRTLMELGLPARARTAAGSSVSLAWLGIPGALALGGTAVFLRRRRR